jgi:serine/threonine-protein kinase
MPGNEHQIDGDAERLIGRILCRKWRIERLIGIGGMSAVYAATHKNGKRVAVKVLHPHLAGTPRARKRFLREGFLANNVDHPGAVSVLDEDVDDDGTVFLVMELLEGETLEKAWKRADRRLPVRRALEIVDAVLEVLARAHAKGVVHRDLKPANVFLTSSGVVKVLDFGIASLRQPSSSDVTTRSGGLLGTPAFMAREQARGRWELVDARTDVWSVGAILFALISGRTVYEGETSNDVLIACATQPPVLLGSVVEGVPEAVAALVDRALSVDKDARWPDASQMRKAIRNVLETDTELGGCAPLAERSLATPTTLSETDVASASSFAHVSRRASRPVPRLALLLAIVAAGMASMAAMFFRRPTSALQGDSGSSTVSVEAGSAETPRMVQSSPPMAREPVSDTAVQAGVAALETSPPADEMAIRARRPASTVGAPSPSAHSQRPAKTDARRTTEQVDDLDDPLLDRRK